MTSDKHHDKNKGWALAQPKYTSFISINPQNWPELISNYISISIDLFLSEMTETWPGKSCEVQHVNVPPCFVLNFLLNQCLQNQWEFCIVLFYFFLSNRKCKYLAKAPSAALTAGFVWCCHPVDTISRCSSLQGRCRQLWQQTKYAWLCKRRQKKPEKKRKYCYTEGQLKRKT